MRITPADRTTNCADANAISLVIGVFCRLLRKESPSMAGLFEELKRRNVFRVGVAYIVVAWLILQFTDLVLENINAPEWVMQIIMLVLVVGLPVALIFAWAFEMTPEGVKREKDIDRSKSHTPRTGKKLDRLIIAVLVLALAVVGVERVSFAGSSETDVISEQVLAAEKSIAVLPFADLSQNQDQEWFADGLAEEILNALTRTPDLLVSSRTSAFAYKGTTKDVPTIASCEKAIEDDPTFSAAYAGAASFWMGQMVRTWTTSDGTDLTPPQMLDAFRRQIDKAIESATNEDDRTFLRAEQATVEMRLKTAIKLYEDYLQNRPNELTAWQSLLLAAELGLRQARDFRGSSVPS